MGKLVGNYRWHQKVTAAAADTTLIGYEVPRGKIAILTYMSIVDYTTSNKKLILGIRDANSVDHYLDVNQGTTGASDTYEKRHTLKIEGELILYEGERPFGIVVSASASDVLYFTAHGGLYAEGAAIG